MQEPQQIQQKVIPFITGAALRNRTQIV